MTLRSKTLKGTLTLSTGQVVFYGCSFVRNVILARLLTKADFGVAATFAITVLLFELTDNMAINRLVVQAKEGDEPSFLAVAHLFQGIMGLVGAGLILALARPFSLVFKVPEACWAFQLLALTPLFKGFSHLGVNCMERHMRFGPVVLIDVIPQVMITLAACPMALWLNDYRVLLWLLLAKGAMMLIASHLLAQRGYRWGWNAAYAKHILAFGWPLLINGFLLFGIFQGDRFAVGVGYTMSDLAVYSVAATLSVAPGLMFIKVLNSILLPVLSRAQDSPAQFKRLYAFSVQSLSLFAAVFATSMIVAGEPLVTLVFGEKYAGAGILLGWLAAAQSLRIIRAAPIIAAMAKADTQTIMISNVFRSVGLGLAVAVAIARLDLYLIAASGLAGEVLAFFAATIRVSKHHNLDVADAFFPAGLLASLIVVAGTLVMFGARSSGWLIILLLVGGLALISLAGTIVLFLYFRCWFCCVISFLRTKMSLLITRFVSKFNEGRTNLGENERQEK